MAHDITNQTSFLDARVSTLGNQLDVELEKASPNFEKLIELICLVQAYIDRTSGRTNDEYVRDLSRQKTVYVTEQQNTYGRASVTGCRYGAALIQLCGAGCGLAGLAGGSAGLGALANPMSYAGQGVGGIGSTNEEGWSSERLKWQHLGEEARRVRDEAGQSKSKAVQNAAEIIQVFSRTMESATQAKRQAVGG